MINIGLTGVLGNPSTSLSSHNAGYTYYIKSRLRQLHPNCNIEILDLRHIEHFAECDLVYLTEGLNFREGVFNLFGGVSSDLETRLRNLCTLDLYHEIRSFGPETIDYTPLVHKRLNGVVLGESWYMPNVKKIVDGEGDLKSTDLVLGDSHSLSVYYERAVLSRNDGKTLYSFLKDGIENYVPRHIENLTFYAGNIDVRHHICRIYEDELDAAEEAHLLAVRLIDALLETKHSLDLKNISVVKLLPIESEDRKIPKTGWYENKPFSGSWLNRSMVRNVFNEALETYGKSSGLEILSFEGFENEKGELDQSFMEARQSVHIAPRHYMFGDSFIF